MTDETKATQGTEAVQDKLTPEQALLQFNKLADDSDGIKTALPTQIGDLPLSEASPDELDNLLKDRIAVVGPAAFLTRVLKQGSYENILFYLATVSSSERLRTANAIDKLSAEELENLKTKLIRDDGVVIADSYLGDMPVSGKQTGARGAAMMLAARSKKIRRIHLINSGFTIECKAPAPDILNVLLMRCRLDLDEYGRRIGAVYYAYFDLILKQNFIQLVVELTVSSTLKDWEQTGVLFQSIKLQDLNHILTCIATLLYPNGFSGFKHICSRPVTPDHPEGCDHTTEITLDIPELIRTRMAALSSDAIAFLSNARKIDAVITQDQLNAYQRLLGFDGRKVEFSGYTFTLKTPTFADHLEAGELFNRELLKVVDGKNREDISSALNFRRLRIFLQCITMVEDSSAGDDRLWSDDKEVISAILDDISQEPGVEDGLYKKLIDFMDETQLTLICYPTFTCSKCGYTPKQKFIPVDAESTFFTMAWQKLAVGIAPKTAS